MDEIAPAVWHWTTRHEHIGMKVSSYYPENERVAIDALMPPEGPEWLAEHGPPEHVLMTNRHHDRHAWRLQDAFGCSVHCIRNGMYEIEGRGRAEAFEFGDELPGGVIVHEIDAICPDETALHVPRHRVLACADGVVRWRGGNDLGFVPDSLMDDPEDTKAALQAAYRGLLGLDFDLLLLAHGDPVLRGAKEALARFAGSS